MYSDKLFSVYTLYNPISQKYYVGITSQNPKDRWKRGRGYSHNIHLTRAVEKYGWDIFEKNIIATGLPFEVASRFEQRLIKECDSYKNGYNQSLGGENSPSFQMSEEARKRISEFRKNIKGEKCWNYGKHVEEIMGDNYETWLTNVKAARQLPTKKWKKVICLNDMRIYDSCEKANEAYGITTVNDICHCKRGTDRYDSRGYEYKFDFYEEGKEYTFNDYNLRHSERAVMCVNTGEIFYKVSEAARVLGCDTSSILKVIKGKIKHAHGYVFEYCGEQYSRKKKAKKSQQQIAPC